MHLPEEPDNKISPQLVRAILAVTLFVFVILAVVIGLNGQKTPKKDTTTQKTETITASSGEASKPSTGYETKVESPSDLDFWDKYPEKEEKVPENTIAPETEEEKPKEPVVDPDDPSTDGKHTLVQLRDGTEEWVLISPYLPRNDYDSTNLVSQSDVMKYYIDGNLTSFWGIDISKYNDYIDFTKVKKAGVDFVMIRVGVRGYGTGQITMDDYFADNLLRAKNADLQVGVYFTSQAITAEEALQEANLVLEAIGDTRIDYPIAIDMGFVDNDTARIEALTRSERTDVMKVFLDTIKEAGYTGMIYGDKEWLIKEIDMSKLTDYDVWLDQPGDLPDYPYRFSMWKYKTNGPVDGVVGFVDYNISFIDYSEK